MKKIPLTQGKFALVDDADFPDVSRFKWHASKNGRRIYARRQAPNPGRKGPRQVTIHLHTFLMPWGKRVDHKDGDGLNCQRHNMRYANHAGNARGFQNKRRGMTSRFRGVCWFARDRKWQAQIRVDDKLIFLGRFQKESEAARTYDAAAREHFGEFASPNFST